MLDDNLIISNFILNLLKCLHVPITMIVLYSLILFEAAEIKPSQTVNGHTMVIIILVMQISHTLFIYLYMLSYNNGVPTENYKNKSFVPNL